jgi:flagellar protein FliO/FliZ
MSPLGAYLVETLVTLIAVIVLAVLVLYAARRMGVGKPAGPLSLVGKLPLDGRRAIYLVRVGKRVFVVGASEAGLAKLGEIGDDGLDLVESEAPPSFAEVLAKIRGKERPKDETDGEETA